MKETPEELFASRDFESRYRRDEAARREQGAKQRSGLTYKKLRKLHSIYY